MGYRVPIKAYGKLKKEQIQYMWVSEAGACEKCQALDGKIYNTADEIPDKPHPNCKCWIDLIENPDVITDPIEQIRAEKREEESVKLELMKLEGDIKCLEDECDIGLEHIEQDLQTLKGYIEKTESEENTAFENINKYDALKSDLLDGKKEIGKIKDKLNIEKEKLKNLENENTIVQAVNDVYEVNAKITDYSHFVNNILTNLKLAVFSLGIDVVGLVEPEAAALWNLALFRVPRKSKYITKNGTYYASIENLDDDNLKQYVYKNIKEQMNKGDSKGIIFKDSSKIAYAIKNSKELKDRIKDYKEKLLKDRKIDNIDLEFPEGNLRHAFHFVKIINIRLDDSDNLNLTVFDTYDFNPKETNFLVKTAREFQEKNKIETYYLMFEIKIPKDEWIKY